LTVARALFACARAEKMEVVMMVGSVVSAPSEALSLQQKIVGAKLADMRRLSLCMGAQGSLLAREKAKSALDGLARLKDDMEGERGISIRFRKSLGALEKALSQLMAGSEPVLVPYDAAMRMDAFKHNIDRKLRITVEDGRPMLCPEMVAVLNAVFYMVSERKDRSIGLNFHKVVNGSESQFIYISGSSLKNLGSEVKDAAVAALELMGCKAEFNGLHMESTGNLVKITVPLRTKA